MCLDESHRWRSAQTLKRLQVDGLSSVPRSIKTEIRTLVHESDKGNASDSVGKVR